MMKDELYPLKVQYQASTHKEVVLGSLPLLIALLFYGWFWVISQIILRFPVSDEDLIGGLIALIPFVLLYLVVFAIGWIRHFPRWWFSYPGFIVLVTILSMKSDIPIMYLFGRNTSPDELGWRAWIPLGVAIIVALIVTRSLQPLKDLAQGLWYDPSRLTFLAYGLMPFLVLVIYDEVLGPLPGVMVVISSLLLTAGAVLYLRSHLPWKRMAVLYGTFLLTMLINTIAVSLYWHNRMLFWMSSPANGWDNAVGMFFFSAYASLILIGIPLTISFLRAWLQHKPIR